MTEPKIFTQSEVKELLTGLLKEILEKAHWKFSPNESVLPTSEHYSIKYCYDT